jgi:transcriptional regulator with XRE-family HTH domain
VVERRGNRRALDIRRQLAEEIRRTREDAGLSQRQLAGLAGVASSTLHAIELDRHDPCLDTLCRVAAALGMDLGVRLFAGTGPLIRDHSQTAMIAALLQEAHGGWIPDPEVWVHRPVRGVIDLVLRKAEPPLVACEAQSDLRRLEQQVRWFRSKAAALAEERDRRLAPPAVAGYPSHPGDRRGVRGFLGGRLPGATCRPPRLDQGWTSVAGRWDRLVPRRGRSCGRHGPAAQGRPARPRGSSPGSTPCASAAASLIERSIDHGT